MPLSSCEPSPIATDKAGAGYVIVSPVKDEESYVLSTLRSVVSQTVRPTKWVVVDDGSTDDTRRILDHYAAEYPWMQVVRIERDSSRDLGRTEICAFWRGYECVAHASWDFIVKLDCDLRLPPDYFERLLAEFHDNPQLGIASGVYLEEHGGEWRAVRMPTYHTAGASKMLRRRCFEEIEGFLSSKGWDTVDEIRASMRGWQTRHFDALPFYHLKREGAAAGVWRTGILHGQIYYVTGGGLLFFATKIIHRAVFGRPPLIGGAAMLWGYLKCLLSGSGRSVTSAERRFYTRLLNVRLLEECWSLLGVER